jgi:soluble lytic murein transglycosylase-like protein
MGIGSLYIYRNLLEKYPDSYYAFHIPREAKKGNLDLERIIFHSKDISVKEFKNNYFPKNNQAQLSAYQAKLLKNIGIYHESVLEIINALNRESGNVYLMYLLTEAYHQSAEYYNAIGWAQTLFNNFLNSNKVEQMPFQVWEYVFPIHYASIIDSWSSDYNLDPFLILSTIKEESHFNRYSESRAGARGLMQIVLSTGEWIAQKLNYQNFDYDFRIQCRSWNH